MNNLLIFEWFILLVGATYADLSEERDEETESVRLVQDARRGNRDQHRQENYSTQPQPQTAEGMGF